VIEIIKPGILSSVQDAGRRGLRHLGVGLSGAMDALALRLANIMVGNPEDAAGIEVTFGGFACRFEADCLLAVSGAVCDIKLDGRLVPGWHTAVAKAGQILEIGAPSTGMRSYLAFAGGVDVPVVLGSRATDLKGGFGGYQGRALRRGDRLDLLGQHASTKSPNTFGICVRSAGLEQGRDAITVRMIPAAEWNDYSVETQREFLDATWRIDSVSNRVGYRLIGPSLAKGRSGELLSHGILPGTVQLPPGGAPAIQMVDANTCGGYPKLGVVIESDLRKLAQAKLGESIRFILVTPAEAMSALRADRFLLSAVQGLAALANQERAEAMADGLGHDESVSLAPASGVFHSTIPNQQSAVPVLAEGESVEQGQPVGYLESGLALLPVTSNVSGRVTKILAQDGAFVDRGAAIVSVNK